jgi:hypothetical protein
MAYPLMPYPPLICCPSSDLVGGVEMDGDISGGVVGDWGDTEDLPVLLALPC